MELQDRRSYFRQLSIWMVGFGIGLIIPAADYTLNGTINMIVVCIFGGAVVVVLGVIGWSFTESLISDRGT